MLSDWRISRMSEAEETPQQRQLRIRQAKREAKLQATGQERLNKITQLNGRVSESSKYRQRRLRTGLTSIAQNQNFTSAASPTSPVSEHDDPPISVPTSRPRPAPTNDPDAARMQEEYIKALIGANNQRPINNDGGAHAQVPGMEGVEDDPMMKMLQTMMGGMSAGGMPGQPGDPNASVPDTASMIGDFAKSMGAPSFLVNLVFGKPPPPPTAAQIKSDSTWKIIRMIFALLVGVYMLYMIDTSVASFGLNPPAPATARNPFLVFMTGELLMYSAKSVLAPPAPVAGLKAYWTAGKALATDGAIVVFMLGLYSWWHGSTNVVK